MMTVRGGKNVRHKLIIDGNAVYEIDDECMQCQEFGAAGTGKYPESGRERSVRKGDREREQGFLLDTGRKKV